MPSTGRHFQANGSMSSDTALQLDYGSSRSWQALVLGRAGMDLYPEPDQCKIQDGKARKEWF